MVEQQRQLVDGRRQRWALLAVFLLAVMVRTVVAVYYGNWLPAAQDDYSYSELGLRLANGYGFTFRQDWYPFTPADTPTAHWSFLYTAFTAAIYAVAGFQPVIVRVVGAVLSGLLLPWIMFHFARRLFGQDQRLALLAAALSAVYAYFILYAARIMTESFYIIALLWSLERALAFKEKVAAGEDKLPTGAWTAASTLGLSLGVTALLRQSVLPWAAVLFLWLLFILGTTALTNRQRAARTVPVFTAGLVMLLCILPFTVRNYLVYGELLLLNSNAGYAMYSAQHPFHGVDFQAFTAAPLPEEIPPHSLNEAQWDKELMQRGLGFILAEPGRYLLLSASRVLDYFEFWPTDTTLLHNVGRLVSFTLFLPFFVAGLWSAVRHTWHDSQSWGEFWSRPAAMVMLFILFYSLLHIFTWAMSRYRLPVDAVAIPFASLAILELGAAFRQRRSLWTGALKHT